MNKNTRTLSILFWLVLFISTANAQYDVEKHYFGPSIGLSFLGSTAQLGLNYEYAFVIKDFGTVGAGGLFRYWGYKESFYGGSWSYTNILIGGQFNYHFKIDNRKFDPWAGAVLAYDAGSVDLKDNRNHYYAEPSHGGLWLGFQGGARYWITPTLALTGRIGFGTLSYGALELGVDFKF
ncbi:MAG: hypothetical protein HXY50_07330 [Ignavibacteriaceae bacterium]|nr:hypothetical protein [Ignavibacteriaceae bacterium]